MVCLQVFKLIIIQTGNQCLFKTALHLCVGEAILTPLPRWQIQTWCPPGYSVLNPISHFHCRGPQCIILQCSLPSRGATVGSHPLLGPCHGSSKWGLFLKSSKQVSICPLTAFPPMLSGMSPPLLPPPPLSVDDLEVGGAPEVLLPGSN